MYKVAALSQEDRDFLFLKSAQELGMPPSIVEKDFWVCIALDVLFHRFSKKDCLLFKGGTSLSKCYHVISRFSEDIDLILKWETLGIENEVLFEERSRTAQDKFGKAMNEKAANWIASKLVPELSDVFDAVNDQVKVEVSPEDRQIVLIHYPRGFETAYVLPIVKLEIGPLASQKSIVEKTISPYCAHSSFQKFFALPETSVPVVSIARTFYEKVLILHG